MRRFCLWILAAAALSAVGGGCALVQPAQTFARSSWRAFRPKPNDYRDVTEESEDQWAFVGEEARGARPVDHDPDPFKRFLMSEKARSIERNLGVD
ncbi:MAG: hypothetical protein GXP27_10000 [Planctomycetes bacterium]|nr:hypothetical protein [Planctomycetota bacterium]